MKAILVMEMPGGCVNCALCRKENRKGYNDYICAPKNQLAPTTIGTDKPDWCPLRPMPEKDNNRYIGEMADWYKQGWNAAIRAIEGSEEDETTNGKE